MSKTFPSTGEPIPGSSSIWSSAALVAATRRNADNERGVFAATKHLLDAGHRRIGFLGGRTGVVLEQRLKGSKAALAERNLKFDEELFAASNPTRQGGYETMNVLLDKKPRATAAICERRPIGLASFTWRSRSS